MKALKQWIVKFLDFWKLCLACQLVFFKRVSGICCVFSVRERERATVIWLIRKWDREPSKLQCTTRNLRGFDSEEVASRVKMTWILLWVHPLNINILGKLPYSPSLLTYLYFKTQLSSLAIESLSFLIFCNWSFSMKIEFFL